MTDPSAAQSRTHSFKNARQGMRHSLIWRVFEIAKILQATPFLSKPQLAQRLEVSTKSIQRDIKFIQEQIGWPLEWDAVRGGFHFTGPVSEFVPLQLTRSELVSLFIAHKALEPLRGTRLERLLSASVKKISAACPEEVSFHWRDLEEAFSVKAAGVLPADVELFNNLLDASMHGKEVAFTYHKLRSSGAEQRRVQPYHVGQIEHGWYLIGHDLDRDDIRTFALQRLSDLRCVGRKFVRPPDFDARKHLSSGFGVWSYGEKESECHAVEVRFTGWAARVVAERQWHATQEIEEQTDGCILFRATVSGLEEITRWILSWGSKAQVLGPRELKKRVAAEVKAMGECS